MTTTIKVTIKSVYGKDVIYPACTQSSLIVQLAKKKTFDKHDIDLMRQIGFTVELVNTSSI